VIAAPRRWRLVAVLAAAACLALAAWGPRVPLSGQTWHHVVMVDVTQSMNTVDMAVGGRSVPRLTFVRQALHDTMSALPCGSRLGLGVFSEYRSLLLITPLEVCTHYDELLAVVDRIDGRMAWAGASEVSRGLSSAVTVANGLPDTPSLIFVSDGHEAPPLRPGARPTLAVAGDLRGAVAGVGGDAPTPIPKFDPNGQLLGVWEANEVMQSDGMSLGRTTGGAQQTLVDEGGKPLQVFAGTGQEHLSSLKQAHLQELARDMGLAYQRLARSEDLARLMVDRRFARALTAPRDVRFVPLIVALALLCAAFWPARSLRWTRSPTGSP
jgi:mxaL protein